MTSSDVISLHRTPYPSHNTTMDTLTLVTLLVAAILSIFFLHFIKKNTSPWILLRFLRNFYRMHDNQAELLEQNNGTILVKRSWFGGKDMLLTSDPANVRHILSTNFSNYPKGAEFRKQFEFFGDSVFTFDFEEWNHHRNAVRSFFSHRLFQQFAEKIVQDCIQIELTSALDQISNNQVVVDLEDLLRRYIYYSACCISTGYKPRFIGLALSEDKLLKATDDACDAITARYLVPESIWKLQRRFGLGKERRLREAEKTMDKIISNYMSMKQEEMSKGEIRNDEEDFSLLKGYTIGNEIFEQLDHKVIKDSTFGLIFAIEDTTSSSLSRFFWLLTKNPKVEAKIRQELEKVRPLTEAKSSSFFSDVEVGKMVYLQAALLETLRLFPPASMVSKTAAKPDTLPSGHHVSQNTMVIISAYAMGRMSMIWGPDCLEFKPERWIMEDGRIRHEPPHKFSAFGAGPRICPGKDVGLKVLETFAATIIYNYHVQVVEDRVGAPKNTFILHLDHGLMVRLIKRWT
ncbi:hypothetical protein SADUNF_Sadunf05G0067900 [Salix dunnii]|uniref:Cytochrome P450 n=1 Tax=Salix dunnii TaxID=1413687 RepID=A0A835KBU8_9ROSI|nr:hypothetical protein SADUNF_Sadunf05G0067900 [Salix dunnii]